MGIYHCTGIGNYEILVSTLDNQGKYEEAEAINWRTLELKEKALGVEHPDTLISVWWLAHLLQNQKRFHDAFILYQRASIGYQEILGLSHPTTLACLKQYKSIIDLMEQQSSIEER